MKSSWGVFSSLWLVASIGEAAVIYHNERGRTGNIPPFDLPIHNNFDVNGDGNIDFTMDWNASLIELRFWIDGPSQVGVIATVGPSGLGAASLAEWFEIGPILGDSSYEIRHFSTFFNLPLVSRISAGPTRGTFFENPGYLGFQFEADDGTHYGYIYLEQVDSFAAIYHGYAYETEPNTPILAGAIPEPSSVLMTLFGGCVLMRRRQRSGNRAG